MEQGLCQTHVASSCHTVVTSASCCTTPFCRIRHAVTDSANTAGHQLCASLALAVPGAPDMSETWSPQQVAVTLLPAGHPG